MTKEEILKKYFGYDSFRSGQERIINDILSGRDVVAIMPTGAGKSLCYQVPALMLPGITIVVSPLISLMKDQVHALNEAGVHAAYINSSLTENQIGKALSYAAQGRYKIVYVAPERLETWGFQNFAKQVDISLVAVDEAHCISQWGQDFRPSYLNITSFIGMLGRRPVLSAFTATATDRVKNDICQALALHQPDVLVTGFDRPNLYFSVKRPQSKMPYLIHYLKGHENESGIIYCATRKNVDSIYDKLSALGLSVTRYHAGLSEQERRENQDDFTYDRKLIVVATNAFGMGIDKSNVRFVVHFNMPQSIENYYQEAGRAGRDGEYAECLLLYSPQDIMINRFLINAGKGVNGARPNYDSPEEMRLQKMINYCTRNGCLRDYILRYFGEDGMDSCNNCSRCLGEAMDDPEAYEDHDAVSGARRRSRSERSAGTGRSIDPESAILNDLGKELFTKLRDLRTQIAREEAIPPYIIFADKTLTDMAAKTPLTKDEMLKVSGVGEAKMEKYGERFLTVIKYLTGNTHKVTAVTASGQPVSFDTPPANGKKPALPKVKVQKADFYLTAEEASNFHYKEDLTAGSLAAVLSELRDKDAVKRLVGTTITATIEEKDLAKTTYPSGHLPAVDISSKGEEFGLYKVDKTSAIGNHYEVLMYAKKAQEIVLTWYIKNEQ